LIFKKKEQHFTNCGTPFVASGELKLRPEILAMLEEQKWLKKVAEESKKMATDEDYRREKTKGLF